MEAWPGLWAACARVKVRTSESGRTMRTIFRIREGLLDESNCIFYGMWRESVRGQRRCRPLKGTSAYALGQLNAVASRLEAWGVLHFVFALSLDRSSAKCRLR